MVFVHSTDRSVSIDKSLVAEFVIKKGGDRNTRARACIIYRTSVLLLLVPQVLHLSDQRIRNTVLDLAIV